MERFSLSTLEYESIKQELLGYAVSYAGRKRIEELAPMVEKRTIERAIAETAEAVALYRKGASVPLPSLEGIEQVVSLLGTGYLFTEQDLTAVQMFLHSCGQLKKYMAAKGELAWRIGIYATDLQDLPALQQEILRCIRHGVIMDDASRELEKIRKKISIVKERIQKRIQAVMARHASILQENIVSVRGGRYVIPVKKTTTSKLMGVCWTNRPAGRPRSSSPRRWQPCKASWSCFKAKRPGRKRKSSDTSPDWSNGKRLT